MSEYSAETEIVNENSKALTNAALDRVLGGLIGGKTSPLTRQAYRYDASLFLKWLQEQALPLNQLKSSDIERYRAWLEASCTKNTAARKLVVARRLLEEAVEHGLIPFNPARKVKGFVLDQETPHTALDAEGARKLLAVIDTTLLQGKRDYAIVSLLIRTGLRRAECAGLRLGDLGYEQGHHIARIRQAKGNKRHKIKIPVDVWRSLEEYLAALGVNLAELSQDKGDQPLFVQFRKGDHPQTLGISGQVIQRLVETACQKANLGLKLTPHGLRATFVTLALEGGAKLEQVQYAVGHADPRTTERYQTRKLNLDNNAVDFIHLF